MPVLRSALILMTGWLLAACGGSDSDSPAPKAEATELVIYSSRNEQLIGPLITAYEEQTGANIKLVTAKIGPLLERLRNEGNNTPADVLLTVDAGNLWQAAASDLLKPLDSPRLEAAIPDHLRDPDNRWFGLSVRARTIVHHPDRLPADQLSDYAALADPRFKGRLCLRTSKKVYNQSLVAMLMAQHGTEQTQAIVEGWVANLATPPFANDTAVMEAILAGQCDVGIVNSYYFGRLQRDNPYLKLALFWPPESSGGVHVNISGAGVVAASDAPAQAQALLEWLAEGQAQALFAGENLEYPANPAVEPEPAVAAWGEFSPNLINVAEAGRRQADAVKLMDRAGYR